MNKKRKIAAAIIATALVTSAAMLVAPSTAHFENTPTWTAAYSTSPKAPESKYLFKDGGRVDLGNVRANDGMTFNIPVNIWVEKGKVSGEIVCTVDPACASYVSAQVSTSSSDNKLDVTEGDEKEVTLDIAVAGNAPVDAPTQASVRVEYNYEAGSSNASIWADFVAVVYPDSYDDSGDSFFVQQENDNHNDTMFKADNKCVAVTSDLILLQYTVPENCIGAAISSAQNSFSLPPLAKYATSTGVTVLNGGGIVKLPASSMETGTLLIDLSKTSAKGQGNFSFSMEAKTADTEFKRDSITVTRPNDTDSAFEAALKGSEAPVTSNKKEITVNITQNQYLRDPGWNTATEESEPSLYTFNIEKLENGKWVRDPVGVEIDVKFTPTSDDSGEIMIKAKGKAETPAGTYRLVIDFLYENIKIEEQTIPFFVDYR